ncbi:MAG TPA: ATP-binding protein [Gammaproteobacteria bacterium]
MDQIIKLITETIPVDYICISQSLGNGKAHKIHAVSGFENNLMFKKGDKINGERATVLTSLLNDEIVFGEEDKEQAERVCRLLNGLHVKNGVCLPIRSMGIQWGGLSIFRKSNYCFSENDVAFIRLMSNVISDSFQNKPLPGFISQQTKSIARAKKQWELAVDLLPQLIIALNFQGKIIRVNRTTETWGIGKVNEANGLSISDFIASITRAECDDSWVTDWPYIWKRIHDTDMLEWKIDQKDIGRVFQFSLRRVLEFDQDNINDEEYCYAVLIVDDITTRQMAEMSLKRHAHELERKVKERTVELQQANEQLEYDLQIQKRDKEALKEFQICRQKLLSELITAQETERKRIACELHDAIGQSIGATKFKVEEFVNSKKNTLSKKDYNQLTDIVDKLKNVINEVRHTAMDIRPAMLDDLGVIATLNWFCREFSLTYTDISINQILNVNENDISNEMKVVIFRIVQEAMNNIAKHANATKIQMELYMSSTDLKLCISDNGKGFDTAFLFNKELSHCRNGISNEICGFGLHSMCERAEATNGKFSVESIPEGGTSVRVVWAGQSK